jgi:hypothetical protein
LKSRCSQHRLDFINERSTCHASGKERHISAYFLWRFGKGNDIGDSQPATGFQHAIRLRKYAPLVRRQIDDAVGDDRVRRRIGDRQRLDLAKAKFDVPITSFDRIGARFGNHRGRHVDADDPTDLADLARRQKAVESAPTAKVDDRFAGLQTGDCLRISAPEPHVGTRWNRTGLGRRIPQSMRQRVEVGIHRAAIRRARCTAAAAVAFRNLTISSANRPADVVVLDLTVDVPSLDVRCLAVFCAAMSGCMTSGGCRAAPATPFTDGLGLGIFFAAGRHPFGCWSAATSGLQMALSVIQLRIHINLR